MDLYKSKREAEALWNENECIEKCGIKKSQPAVTGLDIWLEAMSQGMWEASKTGKGSADSQQGTGTYDCSTTTQN